jgi:hypothetical protein
LGDLKELRIWHDNNGVDLQSSRWKLVKVVVTCLQNSNKAGAGYNQLHPHGKGDHAIRSVKTSDSDQWHFLPSRKWLSCDGGDNLLFIHDEIKRAKRRIQMEKESYEARIHAFQRYATHDHFAGLVPPSGVMLGRYLCPFAGRGFSTTGALLQGH